MDHAGLIASPKDIIFTDGMIRPQFCVHIVYDIPGPLYTSRSC